MAFDARAPPLPISQQQLESLTHLIQTVHRLRAPGGCPWDMKQTHQSLRQYVIEEAVRARATVGEICDVLRGCWGTYQPSTVF